MIVDPGDAKKLATQVELTPTSGGKVVAASGDTDLVRRCRSRPNRHQLGSEGQRQPDRARYPALPAALLGVATSAAQADHMGSIELPTCMGSVTSALARTAAGCRSPAMR